MVNHGARKGCMTCKFRKIQCDLEYPVCGQCTKSGRVCLGYGDRQTPHPTTTDRQSLSSHSSSTPERDDKLRHMEDSTHAVSFLADLLMGTNEDSNEQATLSNDTTVSAIRTIRKCLYALQQTEQSFEDRKALIAEYGTAISQIRVTLMSSLFSPSLACAAFLFSTYEMIVNIDPKDQTWRIHLEGLFNLLSQISHHSDLPTGDFDTLHHAIQISRSEGDNIQAFASYDVSNRVKASLILDVTKLCLQPLVSQVENLTEGERPRKIDMQKSRASIKQIQKNLNLFSNICPKAELDMKKVPPAERLMNALSLVRWNDYHCLRIIIANLLVLTGDFIHPGDNYEDTREFEILSSMIYEAGQHIYSAISVIAETTPIERNHCDEDLRLPIGGFLLLWPICCLLKSQETPQSQQNNIRENLWSIGLRAFIPHASALANSNAETTKWADIIAGLLLTRVALSQEMRYLFDHPSL